MSSTENPPEKIAEVVFLDGKTRSLPFEAIYQHPDVIVIAGPENRVTFVNPLAYQTIELTTTQPWTISDDPR